MEECLAIKPDLIFLWDEAWFAFAGFHPTYRRRTGMGAAARLRDRFRDPEFRQRYLQFKERFGNPDDGDERWLDTRLVPDPDCARIRVYVTHSTHKTLTALRQGSMIHIWDPVLDPPGATSIEEATEARSRLDQAFSTHTSTSAHYGILASLDVGRRQMELEGCDLIGHSIDIARKFNEDFHDTNRRRSTAWSTRCSCPGSRTRSILRGRSTPRAFAVPARDGAGLRPADARL